MEGRLGHDLENISIIGRASKKLIARLLRERLNISPNDRIQNHRWPLACDDSLAKALWPPHQARCGLTSRTRRLCLSAETALSVDCEGWTRAIARVTKASRSVGKPQ